MIEYFVARGETRVLTAQARAQLRGNFARLSDGVTHYELTGPDNGELVLLLPGLTIPLFYWDALADQLHRQGLRTLAYSAYGRGYSDRVVTTYDRSLFVRQAREILERLQVSQVSHVIGTSMGALVSMALVQEKGFRTQTLTLVGPAGLESRMPLAVRIARLGGGVAGLFGRHMGLKGVLAHLDRNVRTKEDAGVLKGMIGDAYAYEGSVYSLFSTLGSFPMLNQQDLYRATAELRIPIMLLWGSEDRVTPVAGMDTARALLRPAECHVIPVCGHMAPFERPEEVATLFSTFVSKLRRAPSTEPSPSLAYSGNEADAFLANAAREGGKGTIQS